MVDKLTDRIKDMRCVHEVDDDLIADQLLKTMEEVGMLPPCKDRSLEHTNASFIYIWEDEDDKESRKVNERIS